MSGLQNEVLIGHAIDMLKTLPDESVDCVVTSPPYYGLRDYGTDPIIWDAKEGCQHEWGDLLPGHHPGQVKQAITESTVEVGQNAPSGQFCTHCGAWRGSLGLEPTPKLYVQHLVQIFREIKRVLKKTGTFWLNLGDSYMSHGSISKEVGGFQGRQRDKNPEYKEAQRIGRDTKPSVIGLKDKDLIGIPWMVAFALRADGWWLRSDIIWSKPNPMPESVTDRPTKSHEYIFLLTKSKDYYFDQDAVREPHTQAIKDGIEPQAEWRTQRKSKGKIQSADTGESKFLNQGGTINRNPGYYGNPSGRNIRTVWTITTQAYRDAHFATFPEKLAENCIKAGSSEKGCCPKCGAPRERIIEKKAVERKREDGQPIAPMPGSDTFDQGSAGSVITKTLRWQPTCECFGHFEDIEVPPWIEVRIPEEEEGFGLIDYEKESARFESYDRKYTGADIGQVEQGMLREKSVERMRAQCRIDAKKLFPNDFAAQKEYIDYFHTHVTHYSEDTKIKKIYIPEGTQPEPVPAVVLDPFTGSGTTVEVAFRLMRNWVGMDINPKYKKLIEKRAKEVREGFFQNQ